MYTSLIILLILLCVMLFFYSDYKRNSKIKKHFKNNIFNRLNNTNIFFKRLLFRILTVILICSLTWLLLLKVQQKENNKSVLAMDIKNKVVILLDTSLSMTTVDTNLSRLDLAKFAIKEIINKNLDSVFAIVPFATSAFLLNPFTRDVNVLEEYLNNINSDIIKSSGTSLTFGLKIALQVFDNVEKEYNKILMIFSDGCDFEHEDENVYKEIAQRNIKTFIFGIGSDKKNPILLYKLSNDNMYKTYNGQVVYTKRDDQNLTKIASFLNAKYIPVEKINQLAKAINSGMNFSNNIITQKSFLIYIIFIICLAFFRLFVTKKSKKISTWKGRFEV